MLERFAKLLTIAVLMLAVGAAAEAAPRSEYWSVWDKSAEGNYKTIDHSRWDGILKRYVVVDAQSGINRFRYGEVSGKDRKDLDRYIDNLADLDPREYRKIEQKAYWMNLYNALSVRLIIENYPALKQSGDIREFTESAWGEPQVKVSGYKLSLNDIEHRILRPIWKDHRIHFGLNCATLGCPNLQPQALTGGSIRTQLKTAGRQFVNNDRGVHYADGKLSASRIFDWYRDDFAKDEKTLLKVFAHYSDDRKALYLLGFQGDIDYVYDWRLNSP